MNLSLKNNRSTDVYSLSRGIQSILDSISGVAWIINSKLDIIAIGRSRWETASQVNDGDDDASISSIIGTNLLDQIGGAEVRRVYRDLIARVLDDNEDEIRFSYRCDSPDTRREMMLLISRFRTQGDHGVLFQSLIVDEQQRVPVNLFRFEDIVDFDEMIPDLGHGEVVTMCSFCQMVKEGFGDSTNSEWIDPEDYYRQGGEAEVRISHGVCERCVDRLSK